MATRIAVTDHKSKKGYHTKMDGIQSISTSPQLNKFCKARVENNVPDTICKFCFAQRYVKMRASLRKCLEDNYETLSARIYSDTELLKLMSKTLTTEMVRIEAFGDVDNMNQVYNYLHIIKLFPHLRFGVWTKNHKLWKEAFDKEGKPENCRYIISSPLKGVELKIENFEYCDSIFTVFPKDVDESIINCGSRSCDGCRRCYFGHDQYIREREK